MSSSLQPGDMIVNLADGTDGEVLDVLGPTVEVLTLSDAPGEQFCVMRGAIAPGVTVPLHSHKDTEDFYIVSGTQQVLIPGPAGFHWCDARAGDYLRVPGGIPHAHRNATDEPVVDIIITTPRLGYFFREAGTPVADLATTGVLQRLSRFRRAADKYGMQLGTPAENAAVGIDVPALPDHIDQ